MARFVQRGVIAAALLLSFASAGFAELRVYLVPRTGDGLTRETSFKPKYVKAGDLGAGLDILNWQAVDYGTEGVFFLFVDVTPEQHTALSAQQDVIAVPSNLDNQIGSLALATAQAKLEAINLPSDWLTQGMTWRQALRTYLKIAQLAQRYQGLFGTVPMWPSGVALDTRWNQLSATMQTRLQQLAASFSLDTSGITNTMTLRQIYRALADQLPAVQVGAEVF